MKRFFTLLVLCSLLATSHITHANSTNNKKIYREMEFIQAFNGKTRQEVEAILGKPVKKETATRPTNADEYTKQAGNTRGKKDAIEMWYYNNVVKFNDKKIYKLAELTFANDKCVNFSFVF